MTSQFASPFDGSGHAARRQGATRRFYAMAAAVLLVLMFIGFGRFYVQGRAYPGRELAPPIRSLLIWHAITMTVWMVLFVVQPLLIVTGRRALHMALGKAGAVLAAAVVVLGYWVGIAATRIAPPELVIWGLSPRAFMTVPLIGITIFALFVTVGIWQRRRPEIHRPMMLLAGLAAIPAAVSRIDTINTLYDGTIWADVFGPFFATVVLGLLLVAANWLLVGRLDRWLAGGFALLAAADVLILRLATTGAWDRFATLLLG